MKKVPKSGRNVEHCVIFVETNKQLRGEDSIVDEIYNKILELAKQAKNTECDRKCDICPLNVYIGNEEDRHWNRTNEITLCDVLDRLLD